MKNILLIVDPQNDFITGTLPVEGAEEKMKNLAEYLKNSGYEYDTVCITMDSHSENHCSFQENGGIWPKHCVFGSWGWDVPSYLDEVFENLPRIACYHKGDTPDVEEYSIFDNTEDGNTLERQITAMIQDGDEVYVDICGIAGDYCVLETLKGLCNIIGNKYITILTDFVASIDGGEKLIDYAEANNINYVIDSSLNLQEYVR